MLGAVIPNLPELDLVALLSCKSEDPQDAALRNKSASAERLIEQLVGWAKAQRCPTSLNWQEHEDEASEHDTHP